MNFYNYSNYEEYTHIVAIGERSGGNESVGDMWLETKVFKKNTPIEQIVNWAKETGVSGKLIITIAEPNKDATNDKDSD